MPARPQFPRWALSFALAACCCLPAGAPADPPLAAQGAEGPASDGVLRYRRFLVPAGKAGEWAPDDSIRYLPIDPAQFDRWLLDANSAPAGSRLPAGVRLAQAEYRARWTGEGPLRGSGRIGVSLASPRTVLVPLAPFGLAVERAAWELAPQTPAIVGTGADGVVKALAEQSDSLLFDWSSRGDEVEAGALRFAFDVPLCERTTIVLDLPVDYAPSVRRGIVESTPEAIDGARRWQIQLGGQTRFDCTLVHVDAQGAAQRKPTVRESTTYSLSPGGLGIVVEWTIDAPPGTISQFEAELDPGLRVVSVRAGDEPAKFAPFTLPEGGAAATISLPRPFAGGSRSVQIEAQAMLQPGQRWMLPRVRPRGMSWQSGSFRLVAPEPLQLTELSPLNCRQTSVGPIPLVPGEELAFQCFSPDAVLGVLVGEQPNLPRVATGVSIDLAADEVHGVCRARLESARLDNDELRAAVLGAWSVQNVTAEPPDALLAWQIDSEGPTRGELSLRLQGGAAEDRPVLLTIVGRIDQSPLGRMLRPSDFRMLAFRAQTAVELASVEAAGPLRLQWFGVESAAWKKAPDLPAAERSLFDLDRTVIVDRQPGGEPGWSVALEPLAPRFRGEAVVDVAVDRAALRETYRLTCSPESAPLDRVLVRFSPARAAPLTWSLEGEPDVRLTAERVSSATPATPAAADGTTPALPGVETWQVRLPKSRNRPFTLLAERETRGSGFAPISLASFADASEQAGRVYVRGDADLSLNIENRRLAVLHAAPPTDADLAPVRGQFQYDPAAEAGQSPAAAFAVERVTGESLPGAWAWHLAIESRLETSGRTMHLASFWIQNDGRKRLEVALPANATWRGAWSDAGPLPAQPTGGRASLALPAGKRFTCVCVEFETADEPAGVLAERTCPAVQADIPILDRTWTAWLPPGHEAVLAEGLALAPATDDRSFWGRGLGPLLRRPDEPRFDPLAPADWRRLASSEPTDERVDTWLAELGRQWDIAVNGDVHASRPGAFRPAGGNLGELLAVASAGLSDDDRFLWIDAQALAAAAIGPNSPLPTREQATSPPTELFAGTNLALCIGSKGVILTTTTRASLEPGCKPDAATPAKFMLRTESQFDRMRRGADGDYAACTPPDHWLRSLSVWTEPALPAAFSSLDRQGWTAVRLLAPADRPVAVRTVSRSARDVAAVSAWLLAFSFGLWRLRARPATTLLAVGVFGAAAAMLPSVLRPLAWASATGMLACLIVSLKRPAANGTGARGRPRGARVASAAGAAGLAGWAVLAAAYAIDAAPADANAEPEAHRVYIPVDESGKPTGDRYLIPEAFHAQLRERAMVATGEPAGWLLLGARYSGTLARDPGTMQFGVAEVQASFDFVVFTPGVALRLPLDRRQLRLAADAVTIDQSVAPLEWAPDGLSASCVAREPGRCTVEFIARPTVQADEESQGFELAVPAVPSAVLELRRAAKAPVPAASTALGASGLADGGARFQALLGPASTLRVAWSATGASPAANVSVEEFAWLRVRPGAVTVEIVLQYDVREGQATRLHLSADPRLAPEPDAIDPLVLSERIEPTPSGAQRIEWTLASPLTGKFRLRRAFSVTGATGVGHFRLPRLEAAGAAVTRRWLAVSVVPSLEASLPGAESLVGVAAADFQSAWGATDERPDRVFQLGANDPPWVLVTRVPAPRTMVDQTMFVRFESGAAAVRFEAELETSLASVFQHRLALPPELTISRVSLFEGGEERTRRFARGDDGQTTVLLTAPVMGRQSLVVEGRLPVPTGEWALPAMGVLGAEVRSTRVALLRADTTLATVVETRGLTNEPLDALPAHARTMGRPVAWLRATEDPIGARVAVFPNETLVRAIQVDSLERADEGWRARIACRVDVQRGQVGTLLFEIPPQWTGPFDVSPAGTTEIVSVPGAARPRLLVTLDAAVGGPFDLTVSAPWHAGSGEEPGLPDVRLSNIAASTRYWRLPRHAGGQPLAWETSDLQVETLPAELNALAPPSTATGDYEAYRVVGESPRGRVQTAAGSATDARVRLAEIHFAWRQDGSYRGWAGFDITPGGAASVPLTLPRHCQIVRAAVDGLLASPLPSPTTVGGEAADGAASEQPPLRLALRGGRLPARIELLFAGRLDAARGERLLLAAPSLGDLPVERTLWSLGPPAAAGTVRVGGDATVLDVADYELFRLKGLAAAALSPEALPPDSPAQLAAWYRPWGMRVVARRAALEELGAAPAEADRIDREIARLHARLQVSADEAAAWSRESPAAAEVEFWRRANGVPPPEQHYMTSSAARVLEVRVAGPSGSPVATRLAGIAILAVFIGAAALARRGWPLAWLREWTAAAGVLFGLAWWLWFAPSFVGWPIVAVSLLSTLRTGWKKPRRESWATRG